MQMASCVSSLGGDHLGSQVRVVPLQGAGTLHFSSQRALGRQGFEMYILFFYFSSPPSKYLGFLPKYLGRIVYCDCCHLPWPSVIWLRLLS